MSVFEAEVRRHTGEEDILTSRVFGTLEILDKSKFLAPILKQCGVELAQEAAPQSFSFSYWREMGKRTPDVILEDKLNLIFFENKLDASLEIGQLVEEYKDGIGCHKNFRLIAVTSDWVEPPEIQQSRGLLTREGIKNPGIQWISWQQIYAILRKNAKNGNRTEGKLISDLLSLLKAKSLRVFSRFDKAQLKSVNELWPQMVEFLEECAAFFGTLSTRLHEKNITCIEKGYTHEVVQTGSKAMGLQASIHWLPRSIAMRAWDNDWKEKEASQGFLIFFRLSPLELEVGYRLGFWKQNLKPMFIEAAQSCALAEKLHPLNCSVSYYGRDYEMLENRVGGDSLNEEAFGLEALRNIEFVIIGRVFNHEEMASPKLLDEVEKCLLHMRDVVNENGLYFSKQTIGGFTPHEAKEPGEAGDDEHPSQNETEEI
jgi:hypothetical protein